jgi:hypothetical protein
MKYLTKGELLGLIGSDADKLAALFTFPEDYVPAEQVKMIKILATKFTWSAGFDFNDPVVVGTMSSLQAMGILTQESLDRLMATPDLPERDDYVITIKALDDVTLGNVSGASYDGTRFTVLADFINQTKNFTITEALYFDSSPSLDEIVSACAERIKALRRAG